MSGPWSENLRTFYVIEKPWCAQWPIHPAEAIFENEDSAHEYVAAVDIDGLLIRRVAVRLEAGFGEEVKGWPR